MVPVHVCLSLFESERLIQPVRCLASWARSQLDEVESLIVRDLKETNHDFHAEMVTSGISIDSDLFDQAEAALQRAADAQERHPPDLVVQRGDNDPSGIRPHELIHPSTRYRLGAGRHLGKKPCETARHLIGDLLEKEGVHCRHKPILT